jgi:hypothetical protein
VGATRQTANLAVRLAGLRGLRGPATRAPRRERASWPRLTVGYWRRPLANMAVDPEHSAPTAVNAMVSATTGHFAMTGAWTVFLYVIFDRSDPSAWRR